MARSSGRKRGMLAAGVAVAALLAVVCTVHVEGRPRAGAGGREVLLPEVPVWSGPPALARRASDRAGVFVVLGAAAEDPSLVETLRIDAETLERKRERSPSQGEGALRFFAATFEKDGFAAVTFRGLAIPYPRPYLFRFPSEGKGPGIRLARSYTGVLRIASGPRRTLLTRWLFNAALLPAVEDVVSVDPDGRLDACRVRTDEGWTLWLFRRGEAPVSAKGGVARRARWEVV